MIELTYTEKKILKFCKDYIELYKFPPSIRDIMAGIGASSTSHVRYYLIRLEEKGLISRVKGQPRSIVITEEGKNV